MTATDPARAATRADQPAAAPGTADQTPDPVPAPQPTAPHGNRIRNCDTAALTRRYAFGAVIRGRQLRRGLSQEKLGEMAGRDRQWVNRIENGANSQTLDRLWPLADALGVPLSQLLAVAEQKLPDSTRAAS